MIALLQRVSSARLHSQISFENDQRKTIAGIKKGIVALIGVGPKDAEEDCLKVLKKIRKLRIFSDSQGKMNLSLDDLNLELLLVSQFTLYADCGQGNRPSFIGAAPRDQARQLYEYLVSQAREQLADRIQNGEFGSDLDVELTNDGPVTLWIDSAVL